MISTFDLTASDHTIIVSWKKSSKSENDKYQIWIKDMSDDSDEKCLTDSWEGSENVYEIENLKAETEYGIRMVENGKNRIPATGYKSVTTLMDEAQRKKEIKKLIQEHKYGTLAVTTEEEEPPVFDVHDDSVTYITSQKKTIDTPLDFIKAIKDSRIYPGALVFVDSDLALGNPNFVELGVKNNGRVKLIPNLSLKEDIDNVTNNDEESIHDKIDEIVRQIGKDCQPGKETERKKKIYSSAEEMELDADLKVNIYGITAKGNSSIKTSSSYSYTLDEVTQECYKIFANWVNGPEDFFGSQITPEKLKQVYADNGNKPIAVIDSVTYGRWAYFYEIKEAKAFSVGNSTGANVYKVVEIDIKEANSKTETNVDSDLIQAGFDGFNSIESISKDGKSLPIVGIDNQPVPMSFTVKLLDSQQKLKIQNTGFYYEKTLKYYPREVYFNVKNESHVVSGTRTRVYVDMDIIKFEKKEVTPANHKQRESLKMKLAQYLYAKETAKIQAPSKVLSGKLLSPKAGGGLLRKATGVGRNNPEIVAIEKLLKSLTDTKIIKYIEANKKSLISNGFTEKELELLCQKEEKRYQYVKSGTRTVTQKFEFEHKDKNKSMRVCVVPKNKGEFFDMESVRVHMSYRHVAAPDSKPLLNTPTEHRSEETNFVKLLVQGSSLGSEEPYFGKIDENTDMTGGVDLNGIPYESI